MSKELGALNEMQTQQSEQLNHAISMVRAEVTSLPSSSERSIDLSEKIGALKERQRHSSSLRGSQPVAPVSAAKEEKRISKIERSSQHDAKRINSRN